ncbi:MAG: DUF6754 domain-containing protein [Chloroflexota bacterium]
MELLATLAIILFTALLLVVLTQRQKRSADVVLRPLPSYNSLKGQMGQAIESGGRLHITLGQGGLHTLASASSVAGLAVLDNLAQEGTISEAAPLVTVGEGTLLPAAQDSLQRGLAKVNPLLPLDARLVQFVAHESDNFAYAVGVASIMQQNRVIGNVMAGRFGAELALIGEAGQRQQVAQVIGTDDPIGLAVAAAVTDQLLVGEEHLAAPAYVEGRPSQIASLQAQDVLRILAAVAVIGTAVYQLLGNQ